MSDRLRDIEKEFHSDDDDDSEETETSEETENESSETEPERDLPKRVLAFTSESLLSQLGRGLKTSVDGTFKSSCSLWRQMFVWMVKDRGYWIPVVFAWLPDKSETSYKGFFYMVLQKKMEIPLNVSIGTAPLNFTIKNITPSRVPCGAPASMFLVEEMLPLYF